MSTGTSFTTDSVSVATGIPATATSPAQMVPPASFTLDEYEHMVECGAFEGEHGIKNVELLWGRISEMPPTGPGHSNGVDELNEWSVRVTLDQAIRIRNQNPVRLPGSQSEPEPDVCWLRKKDYSKVHPGPDDILLLIEVADSSLSRDRQSKLAAYAQAGIQDYWIVNLEEGQVEVYRQPKGLDYAEKQILKGAETVSPLAQPDVSVTANELLAKKAR